MVAAIMAKPSPAKSVPFAQRLPEITILSDHATQGRELEDDVAKLADQDLLALDSRLSSIFDILRHKNTQCPLAIAIYGDWGTGKTSAMRWLETQLNHWNSRQTKRGEHPGTYPVWFDPWRYHTKEDVWRGIIAEVILALFRVSSLKPDNLVPKMVQAAKKFSGFLGRSFVHALANTQVEVEPEAVGTKLGKVSFDGDAFRSIWEEYDKAAHPHKAYLNQFEDTLRSWITDFIAEDQKLSKEHARIVLFIDDLDRCLPEVAMEVLEALKLYLNIPNLIFVVGLDRDVVNAVVCSHYKRSEVPHEKARHYLNKIFQVDLTIPPSEAQMGSFMTQQIKALNKATSGYWHDMLHESGHQGTLEKALTQLARHNPREVKRLLNSALIRGRTAATDPLLDEKLGTAEKDQALRFSQGVQVLLLQRLIHERLLYCEGLLIPQKNLEWLAKASSAVQDVMDAHPDEEADIPNLLTTAQRVEESKGRSNGADEMEVKDSKITPLFKLLKTIPFLNDQQKPVDFSVLNTSLFWQLLSVPFSQEVAQSAPRIEIPTLGGGKSSPDSLLATLPETVRQRLAQAADVPVGELASSHLLKIEDLDLSSLPDLTSRHLSLVRHLPGLQQLDLEGCTGVSDLSALQGLSSLQWLDLKGCTGVSDLSPLQGLSSLHTLSLHGCTGVSDHSPLQGLSSLQELYLNGCTGVSDLSALQGLSSLQRLSLDDCTGVRDLSALQGLSSLQWLDLEGCTGVSDLSALQDLAGLQWLYLNGCTGVSDLSAFQGLSSLQRLYLHGCTGVSDLSALQGLSSLQRLYLNGCTGVSDLSALQGLSSLQRLDLNGCTGVSDLSALQGRSSLQELFLSGCGASKAEADLLRTHLPQCTIYR